MTKGLTIKFVLFIIVDLRFVIKNDPPVKVGRLFCQNVNSITVRRRHSPTIV